MTNTDYQKRLEYLLIKAFDTGYEAARAVKGLADDHYITHQEVMVAEASKALTALCRDVCGEVVKADEWNPFPKRNNYVGIRNKLKAEQRKTAHAVLGQPRENKNER